METATQYRVMAAQCFKSARITRIDEMREIYLQLGQFWLDVASNLDCPPISKVSPRGDFTIWKQR